MSVTTLPYMWAELQDSARSDWYVFECELCDYRTFGGSFHTAEMEAADHLDDTHPAERKAADAATRADAAFLAAIQADVSNRTNT